MQVEVVSKTIGPSIVGKKLAALSCYINFEKSS